MKIVEVLLRNGAKWTISDGNDLLPENYASVNGDSTIQEFKRLCEKERLIRGEEEESIRGEGSRYAERKKTWTANRRKRNWSG